MPIFESPNICRDLPMTPEYRTLAAQVRDNLGHKMVEVKRVFHEQKKTLIGFRVSPVYMAMLRLFCPDVISAFKKDDPALLYGLPVVEDEEVSVIQFEFKED